MPAASVTAWPPCRLRVLVTQDCADELIQAVSNSTSGRVVPQLAASQQADAQQALGEEEQEAVAVKTAAGGQRQQR